MKNSYIKFCILIVAAIEPDVPHDPCLPSPCGAYAECRVVDNRPVCSCVPGNLGAPPNCRPECLIHQDCPSHLACVRTKCRDPCTGSCGFNARCTVQNHRPVCTCQQGYEGDPFSGCSLIPGTCYFISIIIPNRKQIFSLDQLFNLIFLVQQIATVSEIFR